MVVEGTKKVQLQYNRDEDGENAAKEGNRELGMGEILPFPAESEFREAGSRHCMNSPTAAHRDRSYGRINGGKCCHSAPS